MSLKLIPVLKLSSKAKKSGKSRASPSRSEIMRKVRSKDTKPEIIVRSLVHKMGYRFRLHRKDLPGTPDLVFPSRKKVIFVNGCFWHGHDCKRGARVPKENREYWTRKIANNVNRDSKNAEELGLLGWRSFVIWECEVKDESALAQKIAEFLG